MATDAPISLENKISWQLGKLGRIHGKLIPALTELDRLLSQADPNFKNDKKLIWHLEMIKMQQMIGTQCFFDDHFPFIERDAQKIWNRWFPQEQKEIRQEEISVSIPETSTMPEIANNSDIVINETGIVSSPLTRAQVGGNARDIIIGLDSSEVEYKPKIFQKKVSFDTSKNKYYAQQKEDDSFEDYLKNVSDNDDDPVPNKPAAKIPTLKEKLEKKLKREPLENVRKIGKELKIKPEGNKKQLTKKQVTSAIIDNPKIHVKALKVMREVLDTEMGTEYQ